MPTDGEERCGRLPLNNWKRSRKSRAAQIMAMSASNPNWDSLRGDPRFGKIVTSLAPKEVVFR
jgi:hypothetical protein